MYKKESEIKPLERRFRKLKKLKTNANKLKKYDYLSVIYIYKLLQLPAH